MQLRFSYPQDVDEGIKQIIAEVEDKTGLNKGLSYKLAVEVSGHIRRASVTRHKTALRLGANPTGHIEQAAKSVEMIRDGKEIGATVDSPGFGRVDGPITIRAKRTPNLTIPVHAVAYGRRVSTLRSLTGNPIFRPLAKGGKKGVGPYRNFLADIVDGQLRVLYALKPSVVLPQDDGLLPTADVMQSHLVRAMREYMRVKITRLG